MALAPAVINAAVKWLIVNSSTMRQLHERGTNVPV